MSEQDELIWAAFRWWKVALVAVAILAAVTVGLWQAGWWFAAQNTSRQAHVIQNGYANQVALRTQVTNGIADVQAITVQIDTTKGQQKADLKAQRLSEAGQVCYAASQVSAADPLPRPQATWVRKNCSAGIVSPGSPLRKE